MSEKISKISVDGVVYDIASTGGGEVPGDIQEQLSALENKVTEEASAREEGDAKLSEKIESEASRVDGMVNQINENVASSIETLNNNLVQAIETINNGIAAEVTNREEGDAKLQAAIDELAEKVNGEGADLTELEGKIEKNAADIATVNNNLVEAVNNINKNVADGFSTINGGLNNEIRPELEKAVKYEDTATEQNPGRKTIFLNNHDNICGKTTDGSAVNIAMVSKWNKVDLGSSSVEINLNGSAERPTYNDSKQIALLEDVHGNMETIALVKKDDLTYELQVGDKIAGTINIPADQFLKSVEYSAEDKSLTFVFNTSEGEQTSVVDLSSLVDTYVAGNGIELIENGFSIKLDPSSESYLSVSEAGIKVEGINEIKKNVQEVAANLVTVNENLASSIDAINKKAVKYEDVADSNLPERKAIVLKNGDVILGGNLEGGTSSLVQLNRWGVADFGSSSVPFNINTPKDVRPTVQEAGQSGEEAHKIAYLSDVESSSAQIEEVKAALETKADKADVDSAVENINSALDQKADKIAVDAITEQLATKADAESVDNRFATVNEGLDSKADKIAVDAITEKVDGISADLEGVVKYQEFGEGRKTIQLSNYDNISGIDTKGEGHNLVMLSKWDKADFGAPGVELNLNGSADRPTYNDTKEIALTEDIEAAKEGLISYKVLEDGSKTIELANGDSLSGVNAEGVAGFNLAKVTPENKVEIGSAGMDLNLVGSEPRPLFNGSKGIALSEDLETKAAELQDNINLKASQSDLEAYMSATDTKVSELEEKIGNVPTKVSELENDLGFQNEAQVDGKIKEAIDAIPEVDLEPYATKEELAETTKNAVNYQEFGEGRKTIQLANYDNISGIDTKGVGHNIAMVSKWDKVDLGAPGLEVNLNGSAERPTYNDTEEIALLKDVQGIVIPTKVSEFENDANYQSASQVDARIQEVVAAAPEALDTLKELADALGNDPDFAGTVTTELAKKANSIDVYTKEEADAKFITEHQSLEGLATETWVESKGYLTEHQDISGLATKEEVTESSNEVLTNILGRIWTNTDKEESGNFDTSYKHADGSYARIWNETDGGGSQYYNSNKDTLSFVGVNDGNDGIHVQIYSKKKSTNVGARLNATPDGIFYGVGNSASIAPENELVVKKDITEVNTNLEAEIEARSTADTQLQNDLQVEATTAREAEKANADAIVAEVSRATEKEAEIEANLASAVKFTTSTYEGRDKKVITLDNDELINARSNSEDLENKVNVGGKSISLIQLNRWNVVDVGSPYTLTNINTPKGQRPTVQEAGQSGPEANQIAYVSDVAGLSNTLEALNATVQILQSKVDVLTKTNTEVVSVDGSAGELKDSSKDYIVSGSINENAEIVGKSISLKSIKVSDNARLKLNAGDVEAKDLNISGSFPKANGNTVISVNNAEFIVFKDMVFDASEVYNGIEIGLASNSVLPKNILFDNCKFQGEFSNNAILVFGTQDNAIITLNNCYFKKISNALRLSNKSNASGVVVNINNCTVDQWETRAPWQGFLICEDYTNKTEEEVNANNLFGDGKITVNFNNLVHAGVKINPADPASVCGTKNESQVVMVCQDAVAGPEGDYCLSYDAAKFPVVSFK